VLELLRDLGSSPSADPFPLPVLNRLGAQTSGYGEFSIANDGRSYSINYLFKNRGEPAWLAETVVRWWHQDPITCRLHARAVEPIAVSDRVDMPAFHCLELAGCAYLAGSAPRNRRGQAALGVTRDGPPLVAYDRQRCVEFPRRSRARWGVDDDGPHLMCCSSIRQSGG
jgi:hypothetical protein